MLNVVLHRPQIPPNTGNVARQCVGMKAALHVVGPIEFDLSEHAVKRAGLDYWPHLDLKVHEDDAAFFDWLGNRRPWLITKRGRLRFDQPAYAGGDVLIFGNETFSINPELETMLVPLRRMVLANHCHGISAAASPKT